MNYNKAYFQQRVRSIDWTLTEEERCVDKCWEYMESNKRKIIDEMCPIKKPESKRVARTVADSRTNREYL